MKNFYVVKGDVTEIYLRRRNGPPLITLIDTEDLPKLLNLDIRFSAWTKKKNGVQIQSYYAQGKIKENGKWKTVQLHRLIMNTPKGMVVDHINHDTLDNRKANLRNVSQAENAQNRNGACKNSKSGVRGVIWHKEKKKWFAYLCVNYKIRYLGYYDDLEVAKKVVAEARRKYMKYSND